MINNYQKKKQKKVMTFITFFLKFIRRKLIYLSFLIDKCLLRKCFDSYRNNNLSDCVKQTLIFHQSDVNYVIIHSLGY